MCFALFPLVDLANLVMVYLLAVVAVAARLGHGPAALTTIGGVATFVYFFVPHYNSFVLADLAYLPTFLTMLFVGLVVSTLTSSLRAEAIATEERERRSQALYELSRDLAAADVRQRVGAIAEHHLERVFHCQSWLAESTQNGLQLVGAGSCPSPTDWSLPERVMRERRAFRRGRTILQPLVVANESIGIIGCEDIDPDRFCTPDNLQLLESFANNIAIALHRLVVGEQARSAHQRAEDERVRNVMLSSVSHDLRTPLASITGAVTTLIDSGDRLDPPTRLDLMQAIREDAESLERQVRNLLDVTRLESGSVQPNRDWHSLEEIVGCALARVESQLARHPVVLEVPPELPLVPLDAMMIEQLLVNLLENAARYSPAGSPIRISASVAADCVELVVADRGPGIPATDRELVFAKFYRGSGAGVRTDGASHGAGLGLPICRAIASLHEGSIQVEQVPGGGACFRVQLPTDRQAPPAAPPAEPPSEP